MPIVVETTAANANDGTRLIGLVDMIPPIRGLSGRRFVVRVRW